MACWSGRPRCRFSSTLVLVAPVARLVGQSVAVSGGSATRSLSRVQAICQGQSWGEMKDQPSCSGRDPTGNLDQLAAHGRRRRCARSEPCAAKAAVARVRLKAITASTGQAAFAVNTPEGRCASAEPLQIGVDLFDDRVTTMGLARSDRVENRRVGGGEERVEPPHVGQAVLPGRPVLLGLEVGDAAHDQPVRHLVGLGMGGEGGDRVWGARTRWIGWRSRSTAPAPSRPNSAC